MRDDQGRFVPGASGNPGGRPRQSTELRELIEPLLPTLIAALAEIACDPKQTGRTRFMAIKELLDRGMGRVPRAAMLRQAPPPAEPAPLSAPEPAVPSEPCKIPVLRRGPEPAPVVTPANAGVQAGRDGRADRLDSRLRGNDVSRGPASKLDNSVIVGGPPAFPCKTPVLRSAPEPTRPTASSCKTALLMSSTALGSVLASVAASPGKAPVLNSPPALPTRRA